MFALRSAAFACGALALTFSSAAGAQTGRELNIFPIAGGDSDVGVGGGAVGDWAALSPGSPPFRWRLEAFAFVTGKMRANQDLVLPFQDDYLQLVLPRLGPRQRLRIDARLAYTDERTLKYTGIGNASPPFPSGADIVEAEYARIHPTASVELRAHVIDGLYLLAGTAYTENVLTVPAGTILAEQHAVGAPEVQALLGDFDTHGVELLSAEVQFDTRDNEIVTKRGQFHTLRLRVSPPLGDHLPYRYERLTLTTRVYRSYFDDWLTLAARAVGDVLFDDPPFYELARFDETPAIGGGKAVRGVPAQRYYGKVKVFGNLEASGEIWRFDLWKKHYALGLATFFDAGRTWTEISKSHPDLDGTGLGLKYGVGGGLRLQEGRTLLLRLDVAWSPDATPIAAYFAAGQIF